MVPSVATCLGLMEEYGMLAHIRSHSIMVARVTEVLVDKFKGLGLQLDLDLALAGALLHDIAKTPCLETGCDHARVGGDICRRHGFDEIVSIVAGHVLLDHDGTGPLREKDLVYYADKRVNHDHVVSLEMRLAYIMERYAANDSRRQAAIMINFAKCRRLEQHLFRDLDFQPAEIADLVTAGKSQVQL